MKAEDAGIGRLEGWCLSFDDHAFLATLPVSTRLGAAAQLKFLDQCGYFPSQWIQVGDGPVAYLAEQLGANALSAALFPQLRSSYPITSQRSGRTPSTAQSQSSDATM